MRTLRLAPVLALCILLAPTDLLAQHIGLSANVGTRGLGVGVTAQLMETLNGRVDASYFTYSGDGTEVIDDVTVAYNGEGDLLFVSALADWHPMRNGFRLSGGLVYNGLEGRGGVVPLEPIEAGKNSYSPEEVGDLNIDVSFGSKIAPYFGLGFGNAATRKFGFLFDLGVIYSGSPDVNIDATGMLEPTESEAEQIEQNLDWVQWYPMVSLGLSFRVN